MKQCATTVESTAWLGDEEEDWGVMEGLLRRGAVGLAVFAALLTLAAAPALAQPVNVDERYMRQPAGSVLGSSGERVNVVPTAIQGQVLSLQVSGGGVAATQQARVGGLAFTGADIATMVLIGLSAMAVGVVLTRRARPRTSSLD